MQSPPLLVMLNLEVHILCLFQRPILVRNSGEGRKDRSQENLKPEDRGGNSQNFLRKFVIFFLTLRCFYRVVIHRK
jgi:hypothetical protein